MTNRLKKRIALSTWGRKWQQMEDVKGTTCRMNEGYKALEALKMVLSN